LASFNLTSDGVARSPVSGVHEAGQTCALTVDGKQVLVADVGFDFSTLDRVDVASAHGSHLNQGARANTDTVVAVGGQTYQVYNATHAAAQLLIDTHIVNAGHVL
jgi:hypothetical protein